MENSFTEIMNAASILDFEKLTLDTIEKIIQSGKINSLYSHVQTIDEFYNIRWCPPIHDTQTAREYSLLFEKRILSFKYDSLGELLQTINFCRDSYTVKAEWEEYIKHNDSEENYPTLQFLEHELGLNPQQDSPLLAQAIITDQRSLISFVEKWHTAQGENKKWNKPYAPTLENTKLYNFINQQKPEVWLKKIAIQGSVRRGESDDYGTFSGSDRNNTYLLFPLDGWTLAECFRQSYENK